MVLRNTSDTIYNTTPINVEIGLNINDKIEYIPLGIFNIDSVKKDDFTIKITAYDNMSKFKIAYFSSLGDTATLTQVANEIATKTGVQFEGSLPSYNVKKLEGFSCREVLGFIASLCGGNAIIKRNGKFTIVYPTDVDRDIGEGVFDFTREEVKYKIGKITCKVGDNETLSKGSLGSDSMELEFENPWMNETILTDIYNRLNGFEYLGYNIKWQGDLTLDIGDIITYKDDKGVIRKLPIFNRKLSYDGGLDSELTAKGETKNKNSFDSSGSMSKKVNRIVTDLAIVNEALIEKANISDLKATNAEIANLKVRDAEIENVLIKKANIEDLTAINANIKTLFANDATINNALINKADITQLNAVSGKINVLESDTASIKNLLAGNISGESGQLIYLTANNVVIADAVIKDLIAANISVADLMAGTISTNHFRIASDSGKMLIADNTIQISDNNRIRVQIGKDASNDYSMYVWDSSGKLMFDATGLKADGIKNAIIRDDMISSNANIGGGKINISSLITEVNKDTNTQTIKSSKVQLDSENQTLDVSFNTLKTNVNNIGNRVEGNTTQISVQQGQISALISDTSIVEDGSTKKLKDAYANLKLTVNGLNSTVGSHTTNISNVNRDITTVKGDIVTISGKVTAVETEQSSLIQTVNSITQRVEATEITTISLTTQVNTATSTANTANTNAINALNTANSANSLADGKSKVFYTTPTTPYKLGDIWVQGISGEIMKCKTARASGAYVAGDWEKASKYTDDSKANAVEAQVTTTNNKVASLETTVNGINSKVINVESSVTTINGNITNLTTRVTSAEQQITATSIVNKVNEAIANGSIINTVSTTLDKIGFTVNNGALTVKNKAGQVVMNGDADGNLWVQNTMTVGGNTNGSILVKNSGGTAIFSANKNGAFVKDGTMKITCGNISFDGFNYPTGQTRDTTFYAYGNEIIEVDANGSSQTAKRVAKYQGGHAEIVEENIGFNATAQNYRCYMNPKSFITQTTNKSGDYYDTFKVDGTTGSVKANSFAVSNPGDIVDGAPWYGFGTTTIPSDNSFYRQLASHFGLRLRTSNVIIDLPRDGELSINRGAYFNGWLRPKGQYGIYFEDYGGGWYMTDSSWIRAYGGKGILTNSDISCGGSVYTPRVRGIGTGTRVHIGAGNGRIDAGTDNYVRLYSGVSAGTDYGLYLSPYGGVAVKVNGVSKHDFRADGSKLGGSIELEGMTYGMSPTDSPRSLIEDIIFDEIIEGTVKIELDHILAQSLSRYAVFPSNYKVEILEKHKDYFIVKSDSKCTCDFRVVGTRIDHSEQYYEILGGITNGTEEKASY